MKIRLNLEKYHTLLICAILGFEAIKYGIINGLRRFIVLPFSLDTLFMYSALIFLIVVSGFRIIKYTKMSSILLLVMLYISIMLAMLRTTGYDEFFMTILMEYTICAGAFLTARAFTQYGNLLKYLRITSVLIMLAGLVMFSLGFKEQKYNMFFGYSVLTSAVISGDAIFDENEKKKVLHFVCLIVSTFLCLMFGARGPILCLAVFFLVRVLFSKVKRNRKVLLITLLAIVIIGLLIWFEEIICAAIDLTNAMGVNSRFFTLLLSGQISSDSGRSNLITKGFAALNEKSTTILLGLGVGGDRIVISEGWDSDPYGYYPHNLFIEFIMQYGYLVGILLSLLLIVLIIGAFKKASKEQFSVLTILGTIGFVSLMVSKSYLSEPAFFCFLALCMNIATTSRTEIRKSRR